MLGHKPLTFLLPFRGTQAPECPPVGAVCILLRVRTTFLFSHVVKYNALLEYMKYSKTD